MTGEEVVGATPVGERHGVGQAGADELVKASIDGGINFFDTADNAREGARK
jgi:aryl-alcohol dehydrogenase-like predicted oxidoreductase